MVCHLWNSVPGEQREAFYAPDLLSLQEDPVWMCLHFWKVIFDSLRSPLGFVHPWQAEGSPRSSLGHTRPPDLSIRLLFKPQTRSTLEDWFSHFIFIHTNAANTNRSHIQCLSSLRHRVDLTTLPPCCSSFPCPHLHFPYIVFGQRHPHTMPILRRVAL